MSQFHRRDLLTYSGAALAAAAWPWTAAAAAAAPKRKRLLVYTRSQTFEHTVVKLHNDRPSLVDAVLRTLGERLNFEVVCTKDGRVFQPDTLKNFDAVFFETTGDLTKEGGDKHPPMPADGKKALLDFVASGKGFVGAHCASDTFHSPGDRRKNQSADQVDPYIAMLGGEFISHGPQQKAKITVTSPNFPGLKNVADFEMHEEWYSLKNFAPDLHVILVQQTDGMTHADYQRPAYPATWARPHGQGRVFYTSLGHREDVWVSPVMWDVLTGGLNWAFGRVDADVTPNLASAAPQATVMPPEPPAKKK